MEYFLKYMLDPFNYGFINFGINQILIGCYQALGAKLRAFIILVCIVEKDIFMKHFLGLVFHETSLRYAEFSLSTSLIL